MLTDRMVWFRGLLCSWMNVAINEWVNEEIHAEARGSEHQNHLQGLLKPIVEPHPQSF